MADFQYGQETPLPAGNYSGRETPLDPQNYSGEETTLGRAQPEPLRQWRTEAPPPFRDAADELATRLNDYIQRRDIAASSAAAADDFRNNLAGVKRDYTDAVISDPASYDTVRSLVRPSISLLLGSMPGDEKQLEQHHNTISTEIEQDLAHVAVRTLADKNADAARSMLDRVRPQLREGDAEALDGYIGVMDRARGIDAAAQQIQYQKAKTEDEDKTAWNYLAALTAPGTGDLVFKPDWTQRVLADPHVPPDISAALIDTHASLVQNGDAPISDPYTLADLARAAANGQASMPDVLSHAGDTLRLADALSVASFTHNRGDPRAAQLANMLDYARDQLASPENGPAGRVAFARFANWLMPQVRAGAALTPGAENFVLGPTGLQAFAPRAADAVASLAPPPEKRKSLDEIFGGRRG